MKNKVDRQERTRWVLGWKMLILVHLSYWNVMPNDSLECDWGLLFGFYWTLMFMGISVTLC